MDNENATSAPGTNPDGGTIDNNSQGTIDNQIRELMARPQYMDAHTNPAEHRRLVDAVQQLYQKKAGGDFVLNNETGMPSSQTVEGVAESTDDAAFGMIQQGLIDEGKSEMDKLVEMGFERTEITDQIWPHEVEALKAQRLLNEGDHKGAGLILKNALDELAEAGVSDASSIASTKNLLDSFINSDYLDEKLKLELGEQILIRIFQQQNDYRDNLLAALEPDTNADPKERIQQIEGLLTPNLRKSNIQLYEALLDERSKLYQQLHSGNLE